MITLANEAVAQTPFHGSHRGAECFCDSLGRLPVDLHHPCEGLEFVDRVHRRLGDVLGQRQGRGDVAIVRDEAAVDLCLVGKALGGLVGGQLLQRRVAPPAGKHAELAIDLLHEERLEQAKHGDAGFEMRDILRGIGL